MKKLRKYWPVLAVLCFTAVIYAVFHTTVPFKNLDENEVKEVAYLTMHSGYQPLPEEERQFFIETVREIRVMGLGIKVSLDGGLYNEFRLTMTDGTQYILSPYGSYFAINGLSHAYVGKESDRKGGSLNVMFENLPDYYLCG